MDWLWIFVVGTRVGTIGICKVMDELETICRIARTITLLYFRQRRRNFMIYNTGLGHGSYEPIEQTHFLFRTSFKCPSHQKRGELSSHICEFEISI